MHKIIPLFLVSIVVSLSALTLPNKIYKQSHITPEDSYPIYKEMREAKKIFLKGNFKESTPLFIKILLKSSSSKKDKNIDQYDYLYAHYGILSALNRDEKNKKSFIKLSKKILAYLDKSTAKGIWEEGELGQFQMKIYRDIGNALAMTLYKSSKRKDKKLLKEAMRYIKKAEKYIRADSDFYIRETKAQIKNAQAGKPPLSGEKKITITKQIKSKHIDKKKLQKRKKEDNLEKKSKKSSKTE